MRPEWEQAVRRGSISELQRLLDEGADLNARDGHGQTALMLAVLEGQHDAVRWLIEHGADLNHTAKFGLSAAMLAVIRDRPGIVEMLAAAGADLSLRGTGAPGFADKTALDFARERNNAAMVSSLQSKASGAQNTSNPHFETAPSFDAARQLLTFMPVEPTDTCGLALQSIRVHVRDHKLRDVAVGDRTFEAHYGRFVLSESRRDAHEARRLALDVSYGPEPRTLRIAGHEARAYELGPQPPPDDIDGRSPAVVTWHDGEMFFLVASGEMSADSLIGIANSLYTA